MSDTTLNTTPEKAWVERFLLGLAEYGNVSKAAKKAKIHRATAYAERESNADFAAAWEKALKLGVEALEDEARRRAFEGVKRVEAIYYKGVEIGRKTITEYSDTLMIFLLKAHKPELYRDTSRVLNVNVTPEDLESMSDDELDELERKLTQSR